MAVSTINNLVSSKFRFRSPFILLTDIVFDHSFICCQPLTSSSQKEGLKEPHMRAFCVNIKKRKLLSPTSRPRAVEKTLDHDDHTAADEVKNKNVNAADHVKSKREIERELGDVPFVRNKGQLEFREQCFSTLGVGLGAQHLALRCKNHELLTPFFRQRYRNDSCTGRAYSDLSGSFFGNTTFTLTFSQLRFRDPSGVWPLPALEPVLQYSSKRHNERRRMRSSGSGHDDGDRPDAEDERKMKKLKAAIMYIPNPVKWAANKLNISRLRSSLDSSFSEEEFLCGAQLAIILVANMVAENDFQQLDGLVLEEVISWLKSYRKNLSAQEIEALALNEDSIALLKITDVLLSAKENDIFVYIDTVCFALKQSDGVPYLVEIGMRFARDYSLDQPGDWIVSGLTHLRLKSLT